MIIADKIAVRHYNAPSWILKHHVDHWTLEKYVFALKNLASRVKDPIGS